jgi:cytochrome P450
MAADWPVMQKALSHNSPEIMKCPYPFYRELRDVAPVYKDPDAGYYIISTYPLVSKVLRSHQLFSSDVLDMSPLPSDLREVFLPTKSLLVADQPVHTRHKALVNKALSPARIKSFSDDITVLVDQLIDSFIDKGEVDFLKEFAMPLPLAVIADQLGVPRSYSAKFRQWSDAMVVPMAPSATMADKEVIIPVLAEMNDFFGRVFLDKRTNPTDDIISDLATIEIEPIPGVDPPGTPPRQLTLVEGQTIIQLLMVAGNESSTAALCAFVELLARDPGLTARLRADRALIRPAIEESLRLESPLQGFWRIAVQDTELGGVPIPRGAALFVLFASANRDETQFEHGAGVRLDRPNPMNHLAFGSGIHFCPGATLARMEMEISIDAMLRRMDNLRLTPGREDLQHMPSTLVRGLTGLHISFDKMP